MTKKRFYQNSTAIALALAITLPAPAQIAFAQDSTPPVNCEETPDHPDCAVAPEAPAEEPAAEEPAAEQPAPDQPAAEEAQPAPEPEQPAAEEPAPEQPAAEEPAPEQPAAEEVPQEAPEQPAAEEPQAEQPAAEQPAAEEPAPAEPAAEEPAPEEPTVEEEPAMEEAQPEEPAAEQTMEEPKAMEPSAEPEQPAMEEGAAEQPEMQDMQSGERKRRGDDQDETRRMGDRRDGKKRDRADAEQVEEPTIVVPDDVTEEQRGRIRADEKERREEARRNRGETIGAAAVGAILGAVIPALGGRVIQDEGDRIIVERDGEYYVRKDESSLLRDGDAEVTVQRLRGGRTLETVTRRNGVRIETVRDEGGYILKRTRILPNGREIVLIDNRGRDDRRRVDYERRLPPIRVDIPRDRYIMPARRASRQDIFDTITAPPVERVENDYTLREVRESERLRAKVRRVDLDTITFETGSAIVRESQVPLLEDMARAVLALIEQDPSTVILVEGHTDAIGSDVSNLALSDRRAETVARIMVERYGVPPENLVTQGYGEQFLKIDTERAEAQNRRATIRNITPLLTANNR
ncbi:OmpA family protein [Oricola indica]|uniref:OmpA family protein n=1 Tax=Oricola indica TaxID=2872591 RepID=UPI003CCB821E